jgi:hypothetical protein
MRFVAAGHAQGYALGSNALLVSGAGNDEFVAQTHVQGSAGPEAVAMLIDRADRDGYTLDNVPPARPSPPLPTHNTSMGQEAGRGLRPAANGGLSATGGIGALTDLSGNDRYRATHFTALGAAYDPSVTVFLDEDGDDYYSLGNLGLGAVHDDGVVVALLVGAGAASERLQMVPREPIEPGGAAWQSDGRWTLYLQRSADQYGSWQSGPAAACTTCCDRPRACSRSQSGQRC